MSIVVNKNTTQTPITTGGRTATQSVKFIPAPRVYVKAADSLTAAPVQTYYTKSNGVTPSTWNDLGVVEGMAKVTWDKKVKEVRTGIDDYLRAAYAESKNAVIEFVLTQFDDYILEKVSGLTASVITSGSITNYQVGQEDLNQLALMLVIQNKIDGKEWQLYNPAAFLNFSYNEGKDGITLKVTGLLPSFTAAGQTNESFMSTTIFV